MKTMLTETLQDVILNAKLYAMDKKHTKLEPHHVLYSLATTENDVKPILLEFGLTPGKLDIDERGRGGTLTESKDYVAMENIAQFVANIVGDKEINCKHVLIAILSMKNCYASDKIKWLLDDDEDKVIKLYKRVEKSLPNSELLNKYLNSGNGESVPQLDEKHLTEFEYTASTYVADEQTYAIPFTTDLTERALSGGFDPVIGRDVETERVIQTLTRRTKNNPVLVGEAGVGKTAVVEGLAMAIAGGHVPAELQRKRLLELDMAGMVAGTRYRGDFEERLTNVISQVIAAGDVILFVDEIHNMVGAGGTKDGAMDAAEMLKPALARGELQLIGATTTREYRLYIEKDPALERRFQPITVNEPTPELAVQIVKGVKSKYEKHHGVKITDEAIEAAVQLSVRYVTDRFLPDKAFDIIDEACSKLKISAYQVPPRLVELSAELKRVKRKLDMAKASRDAQVIAACEQEYNNLYFEYDHEKKDYQNLLDEYKCVLTAKDVRLVVSQMTGVPVAELSREEKDKLVHLEEELQQRVIGQSEAVKVVSRAVRRQRAGLKDPNRPIGSFIFVGPTGVGKTELAKALSDCLFGANSDVIRIDMSEYMEKASVAKLIGAPPGYVGYDESGYLTEKVLRRPYSVVLFDEIEKAHPDVFNLLLQILDEGRLTDSHGKTVDFRNTVIILTSNIGISDTANSSIGFGQQSDYSSMRDNVERALRKFFRPEFLNRLDEVVVFNYLSQAETERIADLLCYNLYKRLKGVLNLQFTDRSIKALASAGYNKNYGARPLKRTIQREIEDALAEKLLTGEINKGDKVLVDCIDGHITFKKV